MALPTEVAAVLPRDTARSWEVIAPVVPEGVYLAGGTALAVHLRHRVSRDLDFFFHTSTNLDQLTDVLRSLGPFAVTLRDDKTLNGVFSNTRVQFMSVEGQRQLEPTTPVAGIDVAGLGDILAMKLKVIGDRGELRDYFDVMLIEQEGGRTVEEGLGLYMDRWGIDAEHGSLRHIINGLGYFDDVAEDEALPVGRDDIVNYWRKRQPQVVRNIGRFAPRPPARNATGISPRVSPTRPSPSRPSSSMAANGLVWVEPYERSDGTSVSGYWRRR
jgi:Nucleotidyl transferase AbiEii toxin, Type IV TA system